VKGARFRASEKNPGMTKIVTLTFAFLFCKYCIVTIEAVLSATSNLRKSFSVAHSHAGDAVRAEV